MTITAHEIHTDGIVVWLRPEFAERSGELINMADAAELAGVSRAAVSNWVRRHDDFPKAALETGTPRNRHRYYVRDEFVEFVEIQRGRRRPRRPHSPFRSRAAIDADKVAHLITVLDNLGQQEDRLRDRLAKNSARQERVRAQLDELR